MNWKKQHMIMNFSELILKNKLGGCWNTMNEIYEINSIWNVVRKKKKSFITFTMNKNIKSWTVKSEIIQMKT